MPVLPDRSVLSKWREIATQELSIAPVTPQVTQITAGTCRFALRRIAAEAAPGLVNLFNQSLRHGSPVLLPLADCTDSLWVRDNNDGWMLFPWLESTSTDLAPQAFAGALAALHARPLAASLADTLPRRKIMQGSDTGHLSKEILERGSDPEVVCWAEQLVWTSVTQREPWFDCCVQHGDLHPHNILAGPGKEVSFLDCEFAFFGPQLYDLAFWIGCRGADDSEQLGAAPTLDVLADYARLCGIRDLDRATFFPMLIATRLHWLHRWLHDSDSDALHNELAYLARLRMNHSQLEHCWHGALQVGALHSSEKWLVQDALITPAVEQLRDNIVQGNVDNLDSVLSLACDSQNPAADLRFLVIAFAKSADFCRIIDTVRWQEELFARNPGEPALEELAWTLANASLDCARHFQTAALRLLIGKVKSLGAAFPDSQIPVVAQAFVLRNYSVLLAEQKEYSYALAIVDKIGKLSAQYPDMVAVAEEYGRALSSAVIAALRGGSRRMQTRYLQELDSLAKSFPDSPKIHAARSMALKNANQPTP